MDKPNEGMKHHFNTALTGLAAPAIPKDDFAPPGKPAKDKDGKDIVLIEHPQYSSTGAGADNRKLKDNTYAVLVLWHKAEPKPEEFEIKMARMYQALTDANAGNIPASHIAVLYADKMKGDMIGGQKVNDGVQLPKFAVTGPTTRDNWIAALDGTIFGEQHKPGRDARLLIYNTGHGGLKKQEVERETGIAGNGMRRTIFDVFLTGGFDVSPPPGDDSDAHLTNPDGYDSIQIAATHDIIASPLLVNGAPFSLGPPLSVGDGIRHVEDALHPSLRSSSLVYYDLRVPHDLLGMDPLRTRFEFTNLDDPFAVVAFDFAGGTQEMINVVGVPEPGMLGLALVALAALMLRRRHR
jgi:hypothetical protein